MKIRQLKLTVITLLLALLPIMAWAHGDHTGIYNQYITAILHYLSEPHFLMILFGMAAAWIIAKYVA